MRDTSDFGVVVLCDQRLRSRPYGRIFLDSLPPMPRTDRLEDVTHFLRTRLAAAGVAPIAPKLQTG
jgi:ATP-dependent DNA helicase DinG